jgi:serine/threonine protein kinase
MVRDIWSSSLLKATRSPIALRGPIPIEEALTIAKDICEALEAAHEKGIIHRDLKPANIKLTPDGKVKVLDFGLAKAMSGANASPAGRSHQVMEGASLQTTSNSPTLLSAAMTNAGVILGTAGYMSPEQAKGRAADHRSDIFSFGCLLYEMLTGRLTFEGETITEVIASVLKQDPDLSLIPANVHTRVVDLIRRCLVKDPKRRWHAVADVRVEIETILAESRGLKISDSMAGRRPLWQLISLAAATAIAAALLTTSVVWNLRPKPRIEQALDKQIGFVGASLTRLERQVTETSQQVVRTAAAQELTETACKH